MTDQPAFMTRQSAPTIARPSTQRAFISAFLAGPLWGAHHRLWGLFGLTAAVELIGLVAFLSAILSDASTFALIAGVVLVMVARFIDGAVAAYHHKTDRRPGSASSAGPYPALVGLAILVFTYGLSIYRFVAPDPLAVLTRFPAPRRLALSTAQSFDNSVNWMKDNWSGLFDVLTTMLRASLGFVETLFVTTPWPVVGLIALLLALRLSGVRATIFTAAALAYLGLFGFWEKSMATLALVATSVLICVVIGLPLGILCAKSRRALTVLEPVMDVMQTLPTFVYLIPAVAFFSIGKPPGVIATVIFALPPIVRLTAHGIRHVPPHVTEAAHAFGASPTQLLLKVELPLAVPSIRLGINQTIMMCLSMVVVAAMIGSGGLGLDVIRSLQMLQTGQGLLAGIAIVLCAMMLDRMVRGRARRSPQNDS